MAFNGSGTYNLPAGNPVVTGTTISSTTTNNTNSDIATALTNCITRDGQSTPSANLPMNAKKLTGLAAGTSAGDSVRYEQVVLSASLGTNVATFLATPSSANLAAALTDETGSGAAVFATSPTITTPTIASANLTTALTLAGAAGTSGQVLTSAGAGLPTWQTPAGPSAFILLSTVTASGATTADIETTFDGTYDNYVIFASRVRVGTFNADLWCRMKLGGSYLSGAGNYNYTLANIPATTYAGSRNTDTKILLASTLEDTQENQFQVFLSNPTGTTYKKPISWEGSFSNAGTGNRSLVVGAGCSEVVTALTGIRIMASTGTITGTFRLYGIKN
jgi:hypothetical protein